MGHIKDIANQPNRQTFPGALFEIAGEVPLPQCSEAKYEGDNAFTFSPPWYLVDTPKFIGVNLIGKICHILSNPGGNTGDFTIANNNDSALWFTTDCGTGSPTEYYVSDGGALIISRNLASFAAFISAAGYPYTIKGGKLYSNIPSIQLQKACSILFDPLT